ncbi:hypothetical protein [Pontimicrobium aquaticum]|uniref:Uncharacterized protein n=1 Tax=Pontimicrobium aquaticum TaxID=2565367 RepID=A0A4U0EPB4_9FLAO|nr:hypothetical protein [Pontimicrobium aquaticum]TJY33390.1 hypothetical protein E5167_12885 [Pontimicrobium aquaticum]
MSAPNIPINQALTDSLSLKIPLKDCNVIDKRLTSMTCIYYESLDAVDCELYPPKPIIIQSKGITLRIGLVEIPIYDSDLEEKIPTKFISLTLSSKLLKHRYFEGINSSNINTLYNEFIALNVFRCSLETFVNGYASDIDVCINLYVEHRNHYLDALKLLIVDSGTKSKHMHLVNTPDNLGLSINKRQYAKPSLPFIKLYYKEDELLSKSAEFYNTFLFPAYDPLIRNLTRVEATIKNYDHKRRLAHYKILPQFKTLKEYLEFTPKQLNDFVVFSLKSYITPQYRIKSPQLSPTDHIIFELIQNCIIKGYDEDSLLQLVNTFQSNDKKSTYVAQSRMRFKIKKLMGLIVFKDQKLQSKLNYNNHVLSYLKQLNIKL